MAPENSCFQLKARSRKRSQSAAPATKFTHGRHNGTATNTEDQSPHQVKIATKPHPFKKTAPWPWFRSLITPTATKSKWSIQRAHHETWKRIRRLRSENGAILRDFLQICKHKICQLLPQWERRFDHDPTMKVHSATRPFAEVKHLAFEAHLYRKRHSASFSFLKNWQLRISATLLSAPLLSAGTLVCD